MTDPDPELVDAIAQAIRIANPVGAAQTAEVAARVVAERADDLVLAGTLTRVDPARVGMTLHIHTDDTTWPLGQRVRVVPVDPRV